MTDFHSMIPAAAGTWAAVGSPGDVTAHPVIAWAWVRGTVEAHVHLSESGVLTPVSEIPAAVRVFTTDPEDDEGAAYAIVDARAAAVTAWEHAEARRAEDGDQ